MVHVFFVLLMERVKYCFLMGLGSDVISQMGGASLYIFAYCMTGLLIRRTFFPQTPPSSTVVAATLVAAGAFLLPIVGFLATRKPHVYVETMAYWHLGTPMILTDHHMYYHSLAFCFAGIWATLVTKLNAPWFSAQAKAFRRCEAAGGAA